MKEAESDAVKLGERLREVNRALEEEKNKNAVLTARLEVLAKAAASAGVGGVGGVGGGHTDTAGTASNTGGVGVCDVLGEELSPEALKEVDISDAKAEVGLTASCWRSTSCALRSWRRSCSTRRSRWRSCWS